MELTVLAELLRARGLDVAMAGEDDRRLRVSLPSHADESDGVHVPVIITLDRHGSPYWRWGPGTPNLGLSPGWWVEVSV